MVAAVGAAILVGTAAGSASAEPAPSKAGWDGSKYWYKDATGWWRWTSHKDKYLRNSGNGGGNETRGSFRGSEPTFHGRAGFDPASQVYWYNKQGHWYLTSHQDKYLRYKGGSAAPSKNNPSGGHNTNPTFRGKPGWDPTDHVYWYQRNSGWWWTSHKEKYERYAGVTESQAAGSSTAPSSSGAPVRHGTEAAISFALAHLGDPYIWGGNGPHGWDCSGLVKAAFQRVGVTLPRVAEDQYRAVAPISRSELRRGDLVFWTSNGQVSGIHHVAIYLGNSQYVEAPRPGRNVRVSSFNAYNPNMYGRVR